MVHKKLEMEIPDEYIYDKLEDMGLPLGRTTIIEFGGGHKLTERCNLKPQT